MSRHSRQQTHSSIMPWSTVSCRRRDGDGPGVLLDGGWGNGEGSGMDTGLKGGGVSRCWDRFTRNQHMYLNTSWVDTSYDWIFDE